MRNPLSLEPFCGFAFRLPGFSGLALHLPLSIVPSGGCLGPDGPGRAFFCFPQETASVSRVLRGGTWTGDAAVRGPGTG